jgi:hypothetical protein
MRNMPSRCFVKVTHRSKKDSAARPMESGSLQRQYCLMDLVTSREKPQLQWVVEKRCQLIYVPLPFPRILFKAEAKQPKTTSVTESFASFVNFEGAMKRGEDG